MKKYEHTKIEKKWQKKWQSDQVYKTSLDIKDPKMYVLDMFPYPSGVGLHVGHPRGYIGSDVYARKKRMEGFNVLHPMGYDAFGLPAEQYALEHKIHPRKAVEKNVKTFEKQLSMIGLSYDWDRKVNTTDPKYYKWTQWIFLQIYNSWFDNISQRARPIKELVEIFGKMGNENIDAPCNPNVKIFKARQWKEFSKKEKHDILMCYRLAYEGFSEVNWCPHMGTVLANDEIINDDKGNLVSERGFYPVEKKKMRQWFMRITAYADRLLENLSDLDWSDHIKEIQKNWIGRSEGAEIIFRIKDNEEEIKVFTTRADTLFGVTYVVLAPEHDLVERLKKNITNWSEVEKYINNLKNKSEEDRISADKEKTGVELKGIKAINPANDEEVPVWIADYVLATYGTGMVMAVPAHDERDWAFAKKYNLPIKEVIEYPKDFPKDKPYTDYGVVINSEKIPSANGLLSIDAMSEIVEELEYRGQAKEVVRYRMRDAVFARQRYWGEPIPLKHNSDGTITALSAKDLPLELPKVKSYEISGNGESPLSLVKSWVKDGYETNTMPGWAGSSWYFIRYMDPQNDKELASKKNIDYWNQVDMYVGGQEHATGHLLYSRFWTNFLYDIGKLSFKEPFKKMKNQGMILGADSRKMSKRWGNVVNPDDIVKTYGADTLRVYEMFMGPFDQMLPWSTESIIGSRRFLEKVWRVGQKVLDSESKETNKEADVLLHKTIKKVTEDIESFSFNTAISSMMILVNVLEKTEDISRLDFIKFLQILCPFAPHLAEELSSFFGQKKPIVKSSWPVWDKDKVQDETVKIAIQINGKVRSEIDINKESSEADVKKIALEDPNVKKWLEDKEIKRFIYVPGRVINIVV
jgi:leucyl-tRNA synthetase